MLNQFILVFLTLIFYQQEISCDRSLGGGGVVNRHRENDRVSRFQSQNQTLYIRNDWRQTNSAEALAKRGDEHLDKEHNRKVGHVEPLVNENHQTLNIVQNPFIVNTKSSLYNQDSTRENIAQFLTNADAKYNSNSSTKKLKLSAKICKKSGTGSEADPNLNPATVSLKENVLKAHIEEINRINDKLVPDSLESASRTRDNSKIPAESEPLHKPDHAESVGESESVIVNSDFDLTTNKIILKSIHIPTYKNLTIFSGVTIQQNVGQIHDDEFNTFTNDIDKDEDDISKLMARSFETFTRKHVVNVDLQKLYETIFSVVKPSGRKTTARFAFTKNSFLTGFSLGFLAFALKKLLLPFFIGIQIVKSILIAMFLPSILGSVGKLVGKGVTNFAQTSGSSSLGGGAGGGGFHMMGGGGGAGGGGGGGDTIQDFEFKDTSGDTSGAESVGGQGVWSLPPSHLNALGDSTQMGNYMLDGGLTQNKMNVIQRYHSKYNAGNQLNKFGGNTGSFYYKEKPLQDDFKVFQKIPISSHLLANYDPFYSPLLSRIDSVFKQLNYKTESCRERLICAMYNNPAKYAPYSNLVSAQLSRELNELRKPTTDNPEILRFFRYMKAAKDGQDGSQDCGVLYADCSTGNRGGTLETSPPMVTTFNDINRLVQARSYELQEDGEVTRTVTGSDQADVSRTVSDVDRSDDELSRMMTKQDNPEDEEKQSESELIQPQIIEVTQPR